MLYHFVFSFAKDEIYLFLINNNVNKPKLDLMALCRKYFKLIKFK